MFNINFIFSLLSSAWVASSDIFLHPLEWVSLIATSFTEGASFFSSYLLLNVIIFPFELLRPAAAGYYLILRYFSSTPRDYLELSQDTSWLRYGNIPSNPRIYISKAYDCFHYCAVLFDC